MYSSAPERVAVELQLRQRARMVDAAGCRLEHDIFLAATKQNHKFCAHSAVGGGGGGQLPALLRHFAEVPVAADDDNGAGPRAQQSQHARALSRVLPPVLRIVALVVDHLDGGHHNGERHVLLQVQGRQPLQPQPLLPAQYSGAGGVGFGQEVAER